jgi:predicted  nucleic acid-binding Zn-ribbon protein
MPSISKQLDKQGTQVNKIIQMLQPVQRQINSAQRHSELLRQIHSQLKELKKHISQIQNGIGETRKQKKRKVHHTRSTNG